MHRLASRLPHHEALAGELCDTNRDKRLDLSGSFDLSHIYYYLVHKLAHMETRRQESGRSH